VDRATLTSTYIRSGTKLDNICHIAHNCDLGENGFFTAGFMMGGSTKIGRQFVTGGNSVVTAHITLGDNVNARGPIVGHLRRPQRRILRRLSAAAAARRR
jgi:UDP-3-O-[3-hydroxymyristoyl] glucosamine N-acyltransferase